MLPILSIYLAPDGEANFCHQGTWSVFIRLAGCDVGCQWCDTRYSWSHSRGRYMTKGKIVALAKLVSRGCEKVTITGGEPFEHDLLDLVQELRLAFQWITIETAGTEELPPWSTGFFDVGLVIDWKAGSAKSKKLTRYENLLLRSDRHFIKFVVASETDVKDACVIIQAIRKKTKAHLVMSPVGAVKGYRGPTLTPAELVKLMHRYGMPALEVGLNLQLHKYIYPDAARDEELGGYDFSKCKLNPGDVLDLDSEEDC